jgi:predicted Fe-Mo cluster-binding NifX family protein
MKIGLATVEKDLEKQINQTFGRAPYFAIYDSKTKKVEFFDNDARNAAGGAGIKAAQFLVDQKPEAVIAYRMGENSVRVLVGAKIKLFTPSDDKNAIDNIELLLADKLESLVDIHSGYHHG